MLRFIIVGFLCSLGAIFAPSFASADTDKRDVLGTWSFQTQPYRNGACLMTGTMHVTPAPQDGLYACELTAVEICSMWGRSVVRQSCQVRRTGDQVSVISQIDEFLERKVEGLTYMPDNFTLTVQDANRMYGALVSAVTAPAEFRRANDGIS